MEGNEKAVRVLSAEDVDYPHVMVKAELGYDVFCIPKRCRKERKIYVKERVQVPVPVLSENDFPLAARVTDMGYDIKHGGKVEIRDEYRIYNGTFWKPLGKRISSIFGGISPREHVIYNGMWRSWYDSEVVPKCARIIRSARGEAERDILDSAAALVAFGGILWEPCKEPYLSLGYDFALNHYHIDLREDGEPCFGDWDYRLTEADALMERIEALRAEKQHAATSCTPLQVMVFMPEVFSAPLHGEVADLLCALGYKECRESWHAGDFVKRVLFERRDSVAPLLNEYSWHSPSSRGGGSVSWAEVSPSDRWSALNVLIDPFIEDGIKALLVGNGPRLTIEQIVQGAIERYETSMAVVEPVLD